MSGECFVVGGSNSRSTLRHLDNGAEQRDAGCEHDAEADGESEPQIVEPCVHVRERGLQIGLVTSSAMILPGSFGMRLSLFLYHARSRR